MAILERNQASIDSAVTVLVLAAEAARHRHMTVRAVIIRFMNIMEKRICAGFGLFKKTLHFVGCHEHVARFRSLRRADNAHLLHLVHESAGFVEADFEFALQTGD